MAKPIPIPDLETAPYWDAARRHVLMLPRCSGCGHLLFPPKPECPACLTHDVAWVELSGRGTVYTYCVMRVSLVPGYDAPYVVAEVALEEEPDVRITSNVVACPIDQVRIGMPVEVTFEDRTPEVSLPQFRPRRTALEAGTGP